MRRTQKIYYSRQFVKKIRACVVSLDEDSSHLELDKTIIYPEGGGQESDKGLVQHVKSGNVYEIDHAKKVCCQSVNVLDNPSVNVGGLILHHVAPNNPAPLHALEPGDEVTVEIDTLLREQLTTSHSASHLVYLAIQQVRPDAIQGIIGCHIKEGQARLDFVVDQRFAEQEMRQIEEIANGFVKQDCEIKVYPSEVHPDARLWECQGKVLPCGGTHLTSTGTIGPIRLKRKNIGKAKERVICILERPSYHPEKYRELA